MLDAMATVNLETLADIAWGRQDVLELVRKRLRWYVGVRSAWRRIELPPMPDFPEIG